MINKVLITSPLEQFEILYYSFSFVDFTNQLLTLLLITLFLNSLLCLLKENNSLFIVTSNNYQILFDNIYSFVLSIIIDNIGIKNGQKFFILIYSIFIFILFNNFQGLIPYNFTVTSHLILTFSFSLSIFIGTNLFCISLHGLKFFSLFMPRGTPILLAFLLVPIELVSFIFKPISLSIRLFANMMAGHTLLKVIAGFSWKLLNCKGVLFFFHFIPFFVILPLCCLEFAVALIQASIFSILICIYINDAIVLH